MGMDFRHIAGGGAGGIFDIITLMIDREGGLGARTGLVGEGAYLLGGQEFERLGRQGTQRRLRQGWRRQQGDSEKRGGYSVKHGPGPLLWCLAQSNDVGLKRVSSSRH